MPPGRLAERLRPALLRPGERSDPDQSSDLFVGESTEFRELGDEGAGEVGTDPWYVAQQIVLGLPDRALSDEIIEVGVDVCELTLEPADVLLDALLDGR